MVTPHQCYSRYTNVGIRTDLNKDSKQPNLSPNQKAAQLQASCGFETSKLQCSTSRCYNRKESESYL